MSFPTAALRVFLAAPGTCSELQQLVCANAPATDDEWDLLRDTYDKCFELGLCGERECLQMVALIAWRCTTGNLYFNANEVAAKSLMHRSIHAKIKRLSVYMSLQHDPDTCIEALHALVKYLRCTFDTYYFTADDERLKIDDFQHHVMSAVLSMLYRLSCSMYLAELVDMCSWYDQMWHAMVIIRQLLTRDGTAPAIVHSLVLSYVRSYATFLHTCAYDNDLDALNALADTCGDKIRDAVYLTRDERKNYGTQMPFEERRTFLRLMTVLSVRVN